MNFSFLISFTFFVPPKPSSSSFSSRLPSLSHVLPTAWLSTFKRTSVASEPKPAKEKQKKMKNCMSVSSSKFAGGGVRLYGGDAEAFWRLSFGEDSTDGKTSKTVSRSAWYDSDDELDFAPSTFRSSGSNATRIKEKEEAKTFSNTACNVMKMKEFRRDTQILPDINMSRELSRGRMKQNNKVRVFSPRTASRVETFTYTLISISPSEAESLTYFPVFFSCFSNATSFCTIILLLAIVRTNLEQGTSFPGLNIHFTTTGTFYLIQTYGRVTSSKP